MTLTGPTMAVSVFHQKFWKRLEVCEVIDDFFVAIQPILNSLSLGVKWMWILSHCFHHLVSNVVLQVGIFLFLHLYKCNSLFFFSVLINIPHRFYNRWVRQLPGSGATRCRNQFFLKWRPCCQPLRWDSRGPFRLDTFWRNRNGPIAHYRISNFWLVAIYFFWFCNPITRFLNIKRYFNSV